MKNLYSTKLISRSTTFLIPLGSLLILFGIACIILSAINLKYNQSIIFQSSTSLTVSSNSSEQSIWPTLAKGIWCGLFFVAVGVYTLVTYREKTLISIRILALISFISIILSLFLFLSSIIVFQSYIVQGRTSPSQRTSYEQSQVVINALLLVFGVLSFLVSLILAIASLISGDLCQSKSDDDDDDDDEVQQNVYPRPPPAYPVPPYYR